MAYASRVVDQRREVEAPVRRRGILHGIAQALAVAGRLEESGKILAENRILVSPDTALLLGMWNEAEDAWARMRKTAESREHVADRANASIGLARLRSLRGDSSSVATHFLGTRQMPIASAVGFSPRWAVVTGRRR